MEPTASWSLAASDSLGNRCRTKIRKIRRPTSLLPVVIWPLCPKDPCRAQDHHCQTSPIPRLVSSRPQLASSAALNLRQRLHPKHGSGAQHLYQLGCYRVASSDPDPNQVQLAPYPCPLRNPSSAALSSWNYCWTTDRSEIHQQSFDLVRKYP